MAKQSIRQWDPTAANNLDVAGISLVEMVTKPSDVNNIERAEMSQVAQWLSEMSYPAVGGTADALTLTPTTALAALASNVVYTGTVGITNATTTPTLNVSSLGAKVIRKIVGGVDVAVAAADMPAGWPATWVYSTAANSGGGAWVLINPIPNVSLPGDIAYLDVAAQVVTGGARVTSDSLGTITTGTVTLDPGNRPLQHYTNNGAHTLAPGSNTGSILLDITNGSSAGTVTISGWTKVVGAFDTTNAHTFRCSASVGNVGSLLQIQRVS